MGSAGGERSLRALATTSDVVSASGERRAPPKGRLAAGTRDSFRKASTLREHGPKVVRARMTT